MQLLPHQQNINAMRELSLEGIDLLGARHFECLVERMPMFYRSGAL